MHDEGKKPLKAQVLLYPEARLPFDTPAATENNSGFYLECAHNPQAVVIPHAVPLLIRYRQWHILLR